MPSVRDFISRVGLSVAMMVCFASGCERPNPRQTLLPGAKLELKLVSKTERPDAKQTVDPASEKVIYLVDPPVVTSAEIAAVQRSDDTTEGASLVVHLTPEGARQLEEATTAWKGQRVAILINDEILMVPTIHAPLSQSFHISGGKLQKDLDHLMEVLTGRSR